MLLDFFFFIFFTQIFFFLMSGLSILFVLIVFLMSVGNIIGVYIVFEYDAGNWEVCMGYIHVLSTNIIQDTFYIISLNVTLWIGVAFLCSLFEYNVIIHPRVSFLIEIKLRDEG